jgi:hypothetical protein
LTAKTALEKGWVGKFPHPDGKSKRIPEYEMSLDCIFHVGP